VKKDYIMKTQEQNVDSKALTAEERQAVRDEAEFLASHKGYSDRDAFMAAEERVRKAVGKVR